MYRNLKIAVVIPCYNEEKLIQKTIDQLPGLVDYVIAVNDCSTDRTIKKLNVSKRTKASVER
jgi:glycosyltransferase involved in cell wall biosynthesis